MLIVFGTRPEAIKMAPVINAFKKEKKHFIVKVCVSAQHRKMLDDVLSAFKIKCDYDFNVMKNNQSLSYITSAVFSKITGILRSYRPALVLVHGDTATTLAASLGCFCEKIPVAHVEAGLRTYDKFHPFPEEINRTLTDLISEIHFAPTETSAGALLKEKINPGNIFVTGNTVIDAAGIIAGKNARLKSKPLKKILSKEIGAGKYILLTVHRRESFGKPIKDIFLAVKDIALRYPGIHIIYPVHPNPNVRLPAEKILKPLKNLHLTLPLCYPDFIRLMSMCHFVVTDSGGIQEEAPHFGKPVLVLRNVTERPEAVLAGTVKVVGTKRGDVYKNISLLIENNKIRTKMSKAVNPYGDGKASERTLRALKYYFGFSQKRPQSFRN